MSTIFLNADRSAIVPAGSPEAAFGVQPKDMKRLGYDQLPVLGNAELPELPDQDDSLAAHELRSASLLPEPATEPESAAPEPDPEPEAALDEAKEADKPADKAAPKPTNKAAKRPATT